MPFFYFLSSIICLKVRGLLERVRAFHVALDFVYYWAYGAACQGSSLFGRKIRLAAFSCCLGSRERVIAGQTVSPVYMSPLLDEEGLHDSLVDDQTWGYLDFFDVFQILIQHPNPV